VTNHLTYLVLGLGGGAVIAALAIGVVVTHRASNVTNFGHAAIGMYVAFAYYELRRTGDLVLPILGLPARIGLVDRPTVLTALTISVVLAAVVGAVCFLVIFRPLRTAPALARVVASLGLMVYLIGVVDLRFEGPAATSLRLEGPLSTRLVDALGMQVPADRYLLAAVTLVVMAALWIVDRWTRFGLATRAAAENERGALVLGLSPTSIGLTNWILAAVLAGLAVALGLSEAGVRFFWTNAPVRVDSADSLPLQQIRDPEILYRLIPGSTGYYNGTDVTVNSMGLRDREFAVPDPHGPGRMAETKRRA